MLFAKGVASTSSLYGFAMKSAVSKKPRAEIEDSNIEKRCVCLWPSNSIELIDEFLNAKKVVG